MLRTRKHAANSALPVQQSRVAQTPQGRRRPLGNRTTGLGGRAGGACQSDSDFEPLHNSDSGGESATLHMAIRAQQLCTAVTMTVVARPGLAPGRRHAA